ncbi:MULTISPECIES: four-carbon acid sugar kinase family protein [Kribbella]|uniref:four-carbon acid sugar kinase family protein n=1 Tax=Kribbella TaxID=182639 RepID=UPI00104CBB86|nr:MULTISPECIES: four-carbon acid sugar kinase family protein [Kribbella]
MVEAAFYGDDFTGSTDALVQYERLGLRSALLVELPAAEELRTLATRYDAIGVAGIARSLGPAEQEAEIGPILTALRALAPRVVQYKICSTADSSPGLGSLGRALEVGRSLFGTAPIPVLAAQPELGRYTVFGHHFAAEAGRIHRLDRQPTMANHPATPMNESDLRLHLTSQTDLRIGSLDLTTYADLADRYPRVQEDVVVLDALTDADLHRVGSAILAAGNDEPLFTMGSGGLSRAHATALTRGGPAGAGTEEARAGEAGARPGEQVLVVSGSQSARTAEQIERAIAAGWVSLRLDDDPSRVAAVARQTLRAGVSGVVVHTGRATDRAGTAALASLAGGLATVVRTVARSTGVRKVLVAGGDTSGRVLRELGITAVELESTDGFGPGTAVCRTIAGQEFLDGLQVVLKGGQVGSADLFEAFRAY